MGGANHLSGGMHAQWNCANIPPDTLILNCVGVAFASPFVSSHICQVATSQVRPSKHSRNQNARRFHRAESVSTNFDNTSIITSISKFNFDIEVQIYQLRYRSCLRFSKGMFAMVFCGRSKFSTFREIAHQKDDGEVVLCREGMFGGGETGASLIFAGIVAGSDWRVR